VITFIESVLHLTWVIGPSVGGGRYLPVIHGLLRGERSFHHINKLAKVSRGKGVLTGHFVTSVQVLQGVGEGLLCLTILTLCSTYVIQ